MAKRSAEEERLERTRWKLRYDFEFYAPRCLVIVDKRGAEVPFVLKPPQVRLARALLAQFEAGRPQRARILKARQVGFSTEAVGLIVQRATTRKNRRGLHVAQDRKTPGALFDKGKMMWTKLPPAIRPELAYSRDSVTEKLMHFGTASRQDRAAGLLGLESQITIDTAMSTAGGRGLTIHDLHLSERAHWKAEGKKKVNGLIQSVPDEPDTLILDESTANGPGDFKDEWDLAEAGASDYYPCFTPWFEEYAYRIKLNADEMAELEADVGLHPLYGEDELELVELMRAKFEGWREEGIHPASELGLAGGAFERQRVLEHLAWRRWAIPNKSQGVLDYFHQEYPSTPQEAFLASGRPAFPSKLVQRSLDAAKTTELARGALVATKTREMRTRRGVLNVPTRVAWVPWSQLDLAQKRRAKWKMWARPFPGAPAAAGESARPAGAYVVGGDPASGEENGTDPATGRVVLAAHALTVIDHRSLRQVAGWASDQHDADEMADEALKAAIFFNKAWLAIEVTGGWGLGPLRYIAREAHYARTYRRAPQDTALPQDHADQLGWSTDAATKPMMRDLGVQLLREGRDGIMDVELAREMLNYIVDDRGRMKPAEGWRSDRLMSWLIAQMVAREKPTPRAGAVIPVVGGRRRQGQEEVYGAEEGLVQAGGVLPPRGRR
jgi:hypothetical protein